jgi:flagella basal body P-ring formation protein FlgA
MKYITSRWTGGATAIMVLAAAAPADSIRMKNTACLAANAPAITISDVAELDGADAQRFGDVVIAAVDRKDDLLQVTVDQVRAALNEAGVHWGRVDLNGWKTTVRITSALADAPLAMTGAAIDSTLLNTPSNDDQQSPPHIELIASRVVDDNTMTGLIAREMAKRYGVDPQNLRLKFDENDRDVLQLPAESCRIALQSALSADRNASIFETRIWKDGAIMPSRSIAVRADMKINAAYSARELRRGAVLTRADVIAREAWIGEPEFSDILPAGAAVQRIARRNITEGELLRQSDFDRQTVIARGDLVKVRCLVGGVAIAMEAEAHGAGATGDVIELRKPGERETFLARVAGPNEAVVDLAQR